MIASTLCRFISKSASKMWSVVGGRWSVHPLPNCRDALATDHRPPATAQRKLVIPAGTIIRGAMGTRTAILKSKKPAAKKAKKEKHPEGRSKLLSGKRIFPDPITAKTTLPDLIDNVYTAYNAGRLREACRLYTKKMLLNNCTV